MIDEQPGRDGLSRAAERRVRAHLERVFGPELPAALLWTRVEERLPPRGRAEDEELQGCHALPPPAASMLANWLRGTPAGTRAGTARGRGRLRLKSSRYS
jgi:hypothetical protein